MHAKQQGQSLPAIACIDAYVSRRPPQDASFVLQLSNLVNAIRGEEKVLVDGVEGMAAVEVVTRADGHSRPVAALPSRSQRGVMRDCFHRGWLVRPALIFAQIA